MTAVSDRPSRRIDIVLVLTLALGAVLRLLYVWQPMAEAHSWRQITNADIARNLAFGTFDLLHPPVSWGGASGYVGMEFPFVHGIVALLYRAFGEHEGFCRAVSIAFSLGTIVALYRLARSLFDRPTARAAAFLLAVSPSAAFFGRAFLSDTPMLFFMVVAVWRWVVYFDRARTRDLVGATIALALAGLTKLPGILVGAPILAAWWASRGRNVWRDWRTVFALTLAVLVVSGWYWQAERIYQQTRLTQAILHPSGTYPSDIAAAAREMGTVSHWATAGRLLSWDFYHELIDRAWNLHLTPIGFTGALVGFIVCWPPRRLIVDAWMTIAAVFTLVSAEGQYWHEFHQLPVLPPAALYFGFAAAPIFDGRRLAGLRYPQLAAAGLSLAILAGAVQSFRASAVVRDLYRPDSLQYDVISTGRAIERTTDSASLVIATEYEHNGSNSPILLYHSRRKGWSFDVESLSPQVIELLRQRHGAKFFGTTTWDSLERDRPDVVSYLRGFPEVPLGDSPSRSRLFDLHVPLRQDGTAAPLSPFAGAR